MKRGLLVLALLPVLGGCAPLEDKSDWELRHEAQLTAVPSAEVKLPPYPRERDLIEFDVAGPGGFRFFVDPASVGVHEGGEVRYTLVARASAGATNIAYEGMRCNRGEVRLYAVGHDGAWGGRAGEWKPIKRNSSPPWHNALFRDYFCPRAEPVASAQEGVAALRRGGHALSQGFSGDLRREGR